MNLVQINERLKDMPLQAVQQYANGMNPEVPPYLALGELQRREKLQKQSAMSQGAAMGQQPSVKEQIEQKAGLMALQAQQSQQAQQQQAQPRPGPVPENAPQPIPQPEPEMAMARGGIARLPVRPGMFDFAEGGIIAFYEGGDVELQKKIAEAIRKRMKQRTDMTPESMAVTDFDFLDIPEMKKSDLYKKAMAQVMAERQQNEAAPPPAVAAEPAPRPAREPYSGPQQYTLPQQGADWVARKQAEREQNKVERKEEAPPPRLMDGRPNPAYVDFVKRNGLPASAAPQENKEARQKVEAFRAGIPELLAGAGAQGVTKPAPPAEPPVSAAYPDESKRGTAAGLTALPGAAKNPATANLQTNKPPASAAQAVAANTSQQKQPATDTAAPAAAVDSGIPGLNDPAFLDAAKRAMAEPNQQQAIADYEARKKAMGLGDPYGKDQEERINALNAQYQKGLENRGLERLMRVLQARNMGEYSSQYLGAVGAERAADLAQAAKINELMGAIESKRREEGLGGVKTIGEELDRRRQTAAQTAASLGGSQMQAGVSRANQLSQNQTSLQIAEMDRKLRERLHNTPAAQRLSVEEQAIKDYVDAGLTRTQAFEKVKTIASSGDKQNLAELKALQSSLKDRALTDKDAAKLLREVEAKIAEMAGVGGGKKPITKQEYDALPSGATYTAPDGSTRTKG